MDETAAGGQQEPEAVVGKYRRAQRPGVALCARRSGGNTWEITAPPSRNAADPQAAAVVDGWLAAHARAAVTSA
jgi:hypothetical protein